MIGGGGPVARMLVWIMIEIVLKKPAVSVMAGFLLLDLQKLGVANPTLVQPSKKSQAGAAWRPLPL
jgi:hypothetical protein